MATPSMGHAARLGMGDASPVTEAYEFTRCEIGKRGRRLETEGIRGTRSRVAETVVEGPYTVGGVVSLHPTPDNLAALLPRILGGEPAGDTYPLAETLPEFVVTVDKVAGVFTYDGCKVDRAVFRSAAGDDLLLSLAIEGRAETAAAAGSFPAGLSLSADQPHAHHHSTLTLGGVEYETSRVEIGIDNALVTDRFLNAATRSALPESDRRVTLRCDLPYSADEASLYDLAVAGASGSVVYTNGARSITFAFANLKMAAQPIEVHGRDREIILRLDFTAYMSGNDRELVVTNDATA